MSGLYDNGRQAFLDGEVSWRDDSIKAVLLSAAYQVALEADRFLSDIPLSARVAISPPLSGKTSRIGVADADDTVIPGFMGPPVTSLALFADRGSDGSSRLLVHLDSGLGIPLVPNGAAVTIAWSEEPDVKIFRL